MWRVEEKHFNPQIITGKDNDDNHGEDHQRILKKILKTLA
jgi:hypothetical protein